LRRVRADIEAECPDGDSIAAYRYGYAEPFTASTGLSHKLLLLRPVVAGALEHIRRTNPWRVTYFVKARADDERVAVDGEGITKLISCLAIAGGELLRLAPARA